VLDINIPAPMVAASATAILNNINLSNFLGQPSRGVKFVQTLQNAGLPKHF
jgi:hypothetical protein